MIGIDDFAVPPQLPPSQTLPMKYFIDFILIKVYQPVLHLENSNYRPLTIVIGVLRRHPKKMDIRP